MFKCKVLKRLKAIEARVEAIEAALEHIENGVKMLVARLQPITGIVAKPGEPEKR